MPNDVIILTEQSRISHVDHLSAEPLVMVAHLIRLLLTSSDDWDMAWDQKGFRVSGSIYTSVGTKTRNITLVVSSATTLAGITSR